MKNKEKYAKEIAELTCDGMDIAVDEATGTPVNCDNIRCPDCMFNGKICSTALKEWAESEYIEKPAISKRDRVFLEYLGKEYKYIARDKNGELFIYEKEPRKLDDDARWASNCFTDWFCLNCRFSVQFPMIKWEDSKPWSIEDLKKLEVVEEYE